MALFQPTNVIPSSFTVGVVDAIRDLVQISWQVNGNSAMTAYKIEFFENDAGSTPILSASTEKITDGIPSGGFLGADRFGRPKMFTWTAENRTWYAYNSAFKNGNQYKFKITQYWMDGEIEHSVSSIEFNLFNMKSTPQVLIYLTDSTYQAQDVDPLESGSTIPTSIGYFQADYIQEQGDPVRNMRWQIATATLSGDEWEIIDIISDTGEVPTPTLQFEFNGFFDKQIYAVRCMIESEGGQQAENPMSPKDGWIFFTVDIVAQGSYNGNFSLQCLPREDAALLQWTSDEIPPVVNGSYLLRDGYVMLNPKTKIEWSKTGGFSLPWTVAIELFFTVQEVNYTTIRRSQETYSKTYFARGLINSVDVSIPYGEATTSISVDRHSCTVTFPMPTVIQPSYVAKVTINQTPFLPIGRVATIDLGDYAVTITGSLSSSRTYEISVNGTVISLNNIESKRATIVLNSSDVFVYSSGKRIAKQSFIYSYGSRPIRAIDIEADRYSSGVSFRCVTVYKGDLSESILDSIYSDANFKPSWYADNYELYMTANFDGNIDGGEVAKFRIYRQEVGQSSLYPIFYSLGGGILQLKDYGIVSRKTYTYWLYEYDKNDAYLKGAQCTLPGTNDPATISTCFKNYSLLVCDYGSANDAYHVRKQYLFALNLSEGSVGNNNSPTLNENFTSYPTRMSSPQNYASGTLQGLLGAIYTVPALIEQVGGNRHTSKPSTLDYFDSVDLEKELKDLSVTPYTLFLRDMKGRLRMVATSGPISTTTNLKQKQQPITYTLPWVEIGDASNVTIIQTPDDEGWYSGEQALDTHLGIDTQEGVLTANYPNPYGGIKFYLTGVMDKTTK